METIVNQKVSCVVNFAYDASEPDELSIKPGDVIKDVERIPGGWWRGELRGKRGMFPDNFVTVQDQNTTRAGGVHGRCRALYSYQPANPDELPLYVGEVLEVLGEVEEGWWQGRRQGRVGVFPSNFVVMLESNSSGLEPPPVTSPAPALPPKPVKEYCRVLFSYTAVNDDELNLSEGDVVTIISKDAPDRGWWRGELHGRVGLFPDNFVQLLPATQDVEEKKPERPPSKTGSSIYPILNKYSEKTASVKELTTSKISSHRENSMTKESSTTITHTNKSESEKSVHSEVTNEGTPEQVKKPPVPLKKSPTPTSGVGGLLSGLKSKMLSSSEKDKDKSTVSSSSSSSGEWDRTDGALGSKPAVNNTNTFDHVERNSILNDPRAGRVKAPRRRPPSQVFRDDTVVTPPVGLSNGHEVSAEKPVGEKLEEIKPKAREWEKHKAPWMEELKLNQAKKTGGEGKSRSSSTGEPPGLPARAGTGSTDRILECGLEEKRSTHSMEMSKSTSSISNRISVLENFEEAKPRHSLDSKKESGTPDPVPAPKTVHSPTAAGRTLLSMLDEIKKPPAPLPPAPTQTESTTEKTDKTPNVKIEKTETISEKQTEINNVKQAAKVSTIERISQSISKTEEKVVDKVGSVGERRCSMEKHTVKTEKTDGVETLIAQLNNRISNLEKLLEVQNAKFSATIEELNTKLKLESEKRQALQAEVAKLAQCVTQV